MGVLLQIIIGSMLYIDNAVAVINAKKCRGIGL